MLSEECHDRIRLSLSDETGVLCFESFEIVGVTQCKDMEQRLRAYLVGRPLRDVDLARLGALRCDGDGVCVLVCYNPDK